MIRFSTIKASLFAAGLLLAQTERGAAMGAICDFTPEYLRKAIGCDVSIHEVIGAEKSTTPSDQQDDVVLAVRLDSGGGSQGKSTKFFEAHPVLAGQWTEDKEGDGVQRSGGSVLITNDIP